VSDEGGRRRTLGRGLSALFGEETEDYAALDRVRQAKMVPIEHLRPGRFQPRRHFDEDAMQALVASMKERGVLQPLLVRRHPEAPNMYEIVAGERRWRAAQAAGLHEIPVLIRELEDRDALEVALIENIQRQDLSPLEEAEGYRRLMEEFSHTQEELAKAVGKSRSHVANMLRLLALPDPVKELVDGGTISAGHARALIGLDNAADVAAEVARRGLNVRQTEQLAQTAKVAAGKGKPGGAGAPAAGSGAAPSDKDPDTVALERDLSALLGLRVSIDFEGRGGSLTVHYRTLDQLDDVLRRLKQAPPRA
jgi:ParB family transcriptional regulator, chromosome partitioning protein